MNLRPLHRHFAAEITGIDLSKPLAPTEVSSIQNAIDRYAVLVFPEQAAVTDDAQIAFSANFGPVQRSITVHRTDTERRLKREELSDISNVDDNGDRLAANDRRRQLQKPALLWHTDSSFRDPPGRYTFLAARTLPPEGGDTEFADARAAYDALEPKLRETAGRIRVFHTLARSRMLAGAPALSPDELKNLPGAEHPLVRTHPSGRKALYLASHAERIVGWNEVDSRALLDELMAFVARPEFVFAHRWRDGDLLMWDNRCTLHRATPFRDDIFRRDMRRTTVADG
ncbi:MAG: TauD/TfdA family dioxygenase [Pseudomonadota bacterium]